jgi:predicted amidohydrolase
MRLPVLVGQLPVTWDGPANVARIAGWLQQTSRPGDLVVLPEAALTGYDDELSGLDSLDADATAGAIDELGDTVAGLGIHLIVGALQRTPAGWANTAVCLSPGGARWTYQKVNLATHERGRLVAGSALPQLELPAAGGTLRAGVQLCREILFPEQWHVLARGGAQVLVYLTYAANPRVPAGVWRSHLISRAAETQRFVVAANVADPAQHCPSMIISPRGQVLAETSTTRTAALRAELDLDQVSDWYLRQQRADVIDIRYAGDH